MNEGTVGNWVSKTRRKRAVGSSLTGDERAEPAALRRETAQLRMERMCSSLCSGAGVKAGSIAVAGPCGRRWGAVGWIDRASAGWRCRRRGPAAGLPPRLRVLLYTGGCDWNLLGR